MSSPLMFARTMRYVLENSDDPIAELHGMCDDLIANYKRDGKRFTECVDCKKHCLEPFMVHDSVWADEAGLDKKGVMHMECLEKRLGRAIEIKDLTKFPINDPLRQWFAKGLVCIDDWASGAPLE